MNWKVLQREFFVVQIRSQIVRFFSGAPLLSTFLGVAALMAIFELVKELFFKGELTLWESHTITVFVTATFSTVAAYFIRQQADKLTTKAQAAHRKAAGIIQNIFDAVVIIDEKGTIKTFNPAAEKIFGYKEEDVKGLNVKILMPEPYAAEHDGYIEKYLNTNVSKILGKNRREVPGKRANGEIFPMDLITSQMRINERLMFIGVVRDITDYKNAEKELDRLREVEKQILENLQREVSIAAAIQANMIPKSSYLFPQHPQIKAFGVARPAKEMGGDFYDAFPIDDNHIVFVIGDVSGKGVPAALFMMETMALLRSKITKPKKFSSALVTINKLLCKNNETNMFVSLFVGLLNVMTGELRFINGGHNAPLLAHGNGRFDLLTVPINILLGVHEEAQYEVSSFQLEAGDTLVLYTDGVTEAVNDQQEFFSLERTIDVLTSTYADVKVLVHGLLNEITAFCGTQSQSDDITIFALQFNPDSVVSESPVFFEWSDNLSVGIEQIDEQHKTLIELINRLYVEMVSNDAEVETVEEILNELVHYTNVHFGFEERLLFDFGYRDIGTHGKYHDQLRNQLAKLQNKVIESKVSVNTELLGFVKRWLQHHIAIEDKRAFIDVRMKLGDETEGVKLEYQP
ncbi:MAG: bacteriohemerythrin [Propionivibrio sp.]|nr:bacteriohemerythrin [Propionivibrio sp.]